jgi:hypothetical protein
MLEYPLHNSFGSVVPMDYMALQAVANIVRSEGPTTKQGGQSRPKFDWHGMSSLPVTASQSHATYDCLFHKLPNKKG